MQWNVTRLHTYTKIQPQTVHNPYAMTTQRQPALTWHMLTASYHSTLPHMKTHTKYRTAHHHTHTHRVTWPDSHHYTPQSSHNTDLTQNSQHTTHHIARSPHNTVHSLLHGAQLHAHDEFWLGGHVLQHIRLEATQEVGTQQVMELLHLVLLGDVGKLIQKSLQVTGRKAGTKGQSVMENKRGKCSNNPHSKPTNPRWTNYTWESWNYYLSRGYIISQIFIHKHRWGKHKGQSWLNNLVSEAPLF